MPKRSTKSILAALKKASVDIDDDEKVTGLLDDLELSAEEFLSEGQIILQRDEYREIKDDLTKLRQRAKVAEGERDELRTAIDSGDSDNARKAKAYKKTLDEQQPLMEKLLSGQKTRWDESAESIPDNLKPMFRFAKDGEELSSDDILHNTAKLDEYTKIGALKAGDPLPADDPLPEDPPGVPRTQQRQEPGKLTLEKMEKMSPSELTQSGYSYGPDVRSARDS